MKVLMSLLMALMFLGGQAVAEEGNICDGQIGAAYGLCNAYCNAMECNSPEPQASDIACARVSALFEKITGSLPPTPTPPVICPTWTPEYLAPYYNLCCTEVNDDVTDPDNDYYLTDECIGPEQRWLKVEIADFFGDPAQMIMHRDTKEDYIINVATQVTEEEAEACNELLRTLHFSTCKTPN